MSDASAPGRASKDDNKLDGKLLKRLVVFLKPYKRLVILAIVFNILAAGLGPFRAVLVNYAVDDAIKITAVDDDSPTDAGASLTPGATTEPQTPALSPADKQKNAQNDPQTRYDLLQFYCLSIFGLLVLQGLLQYFLTLLMNWIGQNTINDVRTTLFDIVQRLSLRFYDTNPIGRLITRVTSDVEVLQTMYTDSLVMIISNVFQLVFIVAAMFIVSWQLAFATLAIVPLLLIATSIFRRHVREAFRSIRGLVSRMNAFLNEYITGISVVQLFSQERKQAAKFDKINKEHTDEQIRTVTYYALFFPVVDFLTSMSTAITVGFGGWAITGGSVELGDLIAFILLFELFFRPLRELSDKYNALQNAMASSERIFELLDEDSFISDSPQAQDMPRLARAVEFNKVGFAYDGVNFVLDDISFTVNKGETIAIVGATGAGKSSIINLLTRFYEFQRGSIRVDGVDIRDLRQNSLRSHIAIVLQDVFMFSRSVLDNITLGDENITREDAVAAAKAVGAHDFIERLPQGYDTQVRERGSTLSVGQRQLLSFCRALAADPDILILDEATSSVDTATEQIIEAAISRLLAGRTSIVIAHRLSTVRRADRIIVMHRGKMYEQGSHEELIAADGLYAKLYKLQYKEQLTTPLDS